MLGDSQRQRARGLTGEELTNRATEQAWLFGANIVITRAAGLAARGQERLVRLLARDGEGFILTGRDLHRAGQLPAGWPLDRPPLLLETSTPGVFAAGHVRHRSVKPVASAIGEGAIAVQLLHEYLQAESK